MNRRLELFSIVLFALYAGVVAGGVISCRAAAAEWPSYNKTLTSERFSDLSRINTKNVAKLKVLCTFDTGRLTSLDGRSP